MPDENMVEIAALDDEQLWEAAEAHRELIRNAQSPEDEAELRRQLNEIEIVRQQRRIAGYRRQLDLLSEHDDQARLEAKIESAEQGLAKMQRGEMPSDGTIVQSIG